MAMNAVTADSFAGLVALALERMAFLITEPVDQAAAEVLVKAAAHAAIEIKGSERHVLCVSATPGLVREVASGMMGVDADEIDVDDHGRATVGELANILGGELVMLMTSGEGEMALGLPREVTDEEAGQLLDRASENGFSCVVGSDACMLLVAVHCA
jgi:CheY-specific phosphatase CheX